MERKDFIRSACGLCATLAIPGIVVSSLSSCSALPRIVDRSEGKYFSLPIETMNDKKLLVIQRNNAEFDAVLVKMEDGSFVSVELKCSHESQPLTPTETGYFCSSHGSRFNLSGDVITEPAIRPLNKFRTEIIDSNIIIHFES
jgi:Rieske Fe-S protein